MWLLLLLTSSLVAIVCRTHVGMIPYLPLTPIYVGIVRLLAGIRVSATLLLPRMHALITVHGLLLLHHLHLLLLVVHLLLLLQLHLVLVLA